MRKDIRKRMLRLAEIFHEAGWENASFRCLLSWASGINVLMD